LHPYRIHAASASIQKQKVQNIRAEIIARRILESNFGGKADFSELCELHFDLFFRPDSVFDSDKISRGTEWMALLFNTFAQKHKKSAQTTARVLASEWMDLCIRRRLVSHCLDFPMKAEIPISYKPAGLTAGLFRGYQKLAAKVLG